MAQNRTMTSHIEMFVPEQSVWICSGNLWRKTMDRRVQRTGCAASGPNFTDDREGYEVITVQDIIDRANVGRSTFYTHYVGKQDLLRSGLKHLKQHLVAHQRAALAQKGSFRERGFGFSLACLSTCIPTGMSITQSWAGKAA